MEVKKLTTLAICLAASVLPVLAQYDQNIAVEGEYVPEFINHDRIGVFPRPVSFPLEKSALPYSFAGVNANFTPQAVPMQAMAWNSTRDYFNARGYLDLGIGSWLESTLSAGYRFVDTRRSTLGIRLQHNSTSLWKPLADQDIDTRAGRYDESIGVYGHHVFDNAGRLDAALDYHLGYFNYYGFNPGLPEMLPDNPDFKAPTQTLNNIAARLGWQSAATGDNITWHAAAGVRYFGYRTYYLPSSSFTSQSMTGGRETDVNIEAGINFPVTSASSVGLDLDADILHYAKPEWHGDAHYADALPRLDSYGLVALTPYYNLTRRKLNIRLGVRVDIAANAGPQNDRYGTFHIAPGIRLDYDAGPVKLFAHALGGSELHTLASGYQLDYYQAPALSRTTPVYTPVDAKAGFAFGPFSGFDASFDIAFRASRGQYTGGFYETYLNGEAGLMGLMLGGELDGRPVDYSLKPAARYNLSGFSFGLHAGYDAGRYFKITADARYQHQNGKTGYFNGYDRPEWTADLAVESNPWSTLKLRLGYNLRAMRMMPVEAHYADTSVLNSNLLADYRLPNMSMLNLGASYGISRHLNVWLQADNLLNRITYYMPGLPEPGIRLAAGVGLIF